MKLFVFPSIIVASAIGFRAFFNSTQTLAASNNTAVSVYTYQPIDVSFLCPTPQLSCNNPSNPPQTIYGCFDQFGNEPPPGQTPCAGQPQPPTVPCSCIRGFIVGDPIFNGFNGQSYQVHGLPGAVFNLITHQNLQVNARFEYIEKGRIQGVINEIREKSSSSIKLPDTAAWTHPGTYLGEISIQTQFAKVSFKSGKFESGIESCLAENKSGEKSDLANVNDVFYLSEDQKQFVKRVSTHKVQIVSSIVTMDLVNSDAFFNLQSALLSSSVNATEVSGLLGASASPLFKQWSGNQVFQFLVSSNNSKNKNQVQNSNLDLFGNEFKWNKFQIG